MVNNSTSLYLFNVKLQICHASSGRKQVNQCSKLSRKDGGVDNWGNGIWNSTQCCIGVNNLAFCTSGYKAPTHFQNQQNRSMTCKECGTLQTRYPLCTTDRLSTGMQEDTTYPQPVDTLGSSDIYLTTQHN